MASPSHDSVVETQKKVKRRGLTFMKDVIRSRSKGIKTEVTWNLNGQPIGANGKHLVSYIGTIVRQTVPITFGNWKDEALDRLKGDIWRDIQMTFDVDETRQKYVLQEAGKLHRTFRSYLTNKYLRDDDGNIIDEPPPQYAEIIKMDDWRAFVVKRTEDENFQKISNDNRLRASNPPYPYRGSCQKDVFPPQKRPKQSDVEEIAKLKRMIAHVRKQVDMLKSSKQDKEMVERHELILPTPPSSKDSCTFGSPISIPEVPAKSTSKAKGKVSEHTKRVIRTPIKVSQPSTPTVGKGHTRGSIASPVKNESKSQPSLGPSQDYLTYLRVHVSIKMQGRDQILIDMEEEILGYCHTLPFGVDELNEVLNHGQLCQYVLSIYMRYLYREVLIPEERTSRFAFLCPDRTALQGLSGQPQYIADRLAMTSKEYETLFLAPCNVGGHWVLLVINPIEDTVYYLDPLQHSYINHGKMPNTFNSALQIYRARNEANVFRKKCKTKWIFIECPRQTNNIDCGYYVMKFMKDIIVQNQMQIPTMYFPNYKCDTYSVDQLTELKEEWCHYFVMNHIN